MDLIRYQQLVMMLLCFSNGNCCLLSWDINSFNVLRLVWIRTPVAATAVTFGSSVDQFAIGWADGKTTLFRLDPDLFQDAKPQAITRVRDYALDRFKTHVTSVSISSDDQALAVGYLCGGVGVFSILGTQLLEDLVSQRGICDLFWGRDDHTLVVIPFSIENKEDQDEFIATEFDCKLNVGSDGLQMSLSGEPKKNGCWIRSTNSFVRKQPDVKGPAEACGLLQGGDILIGINHTNVQNETFDAIVTLFQQLPKDREVSLRWIRLDYEQAFETIAKVMDLYEEYNRLGYVSDEEDESDPKLVRMAQLEPIAQLFRDEISEDDAILEFGLRMQATAGEYYDMKEPIPPPRWLEFEKRAKLDGWKSLQGVSKQVAKQRYVRVVLSLFSEWKPEQAFWEHLQSLCAPEEKAIEQTSIAQWVEFTWARSCVGGGKVLLGSDRFHLCTTQRFDPSVLDWECVPVPLSYGSIAWPLRRAAVNMKNTCVAVAGTRGFAIYSIVADKWRRFGNCHEELELEVVSMLWVHSDIIAILGRKRSQLDDSIQDIMLQFYPRDHLIESSILHTETLPNEATLLSRDEKFIYCLSKGKVAVYSYSTAGSIKDHSLELHLNAVLAVTIAPSIARHFRAGVTEFIPLPTIQRLNPPVEDASEEASSSSWFSLYGILNSLGGIESPNETYRLPRFAFLDYHGTLHVWNPNTSTHTVLQRNVARLMRFPIENTTLPDLYLIYSCEGLQLWLPQLDGVVWTRPEILTREWLEVNLEMFFQCQDPERIKTDLPRLIQSCSSETDLLDLVYKQYGLGSCQALPQHRYTPTEPKSQDHLDIETRFAYVSTLDYAHVATDYLLNQLDDEVSMLGIDPRTRVLIGTRTDAYLSTFAMKCQTQPVWPVMIRFFIHMNRLDWAKSVMEECEQSHLGSISFELSLFSILEDTNTSGGQALEATLALFHETCRAYNEIVAHVARKIEPSRLKLLFPAAGVPEELFETCVRDGELYTASKYLVLLGTEGIGLDQLMQHASDLIQACFELGQHDTLAQQVIGLTQKWTNVGQPPLLEGLLETYLLKLLVECKWTTMLEYLELYHLPFPTPIPEFKQNQVEHILQTTMDPDQIQSFLQFIPSDTDFHHQILITI